MLHTGTFLALVIYFFKDLVYFVKKEPRFLLIIILASIPAGAVGFFLEDYIDLYLHNLIVVIAMFIIVGLLFLFVEKNYRPRIDCKQLTWQKGLIIGFMQIIALIPGTSRSGICIISGMYLKLKRSEAARFSFLISLPIFALATLKKLYDLSIIGVAISEWQIMLIGVFVSFFVGYFCLKYLLKYLQTHSLYLFAYYRFIIAFFLIIYLLFK